MATDFLVLAEYAKAFGRNAAGLPVLASPASPLAALAGYPLAYEKPAGAGRISFIGRRR